MLPTRKSNDPARPNHTGPPKPVGEVASLLREAKVGNRAAAEMLVRVYADPVFGFLRSRLNSRSEAEDVAQNVFVKALSKLHTVNDEFEPWLWAIAWNELRTFFRKRAMPTLPDNCPEPDLPLEIAPVEIEEERRRLEECVSKLDSNLKEVVELRFLSGMMLDAIAAHKEIAVSTAHARCEKALRQLRDCMDGTES